MLAFAAVIFVLMWAFVAVTHSETVGGVCFGVGDTEGTMGGSLQPTAGRLCFGVGDLCFGVGVPEGTMGGSLQPN